MAEFFPIDSDQFNTVTPTGTEEIQISATQKASLKSIADLFKLKGKIKPYHGGGSDIEVTDVSGENAVELRVIHHINEIPFKDYPGDKKFDKGEWVELDLPHAEWGELLGDVVSNSGLLVLTYDDGIEAYRYPVFQSGTYDDTVSTLSFIHHYYDTSSRKAIYALIEAEVNPSNVNDGYAALLITNKVILNDDTAVGDVLGTILNGLVTTPSGTIFSGGEQYLSTDSLLTFLNKLISNTCYNNLRIVPGPSGLFIMFGNTSTTGTGLIRFMCSRLGQARLIYYYTETKFIRDFLGKDYSFIQQSLDSSDWNKNVDIDLTALSGGSSYELPTASSTVLGGVKIPSTGGLTTDAQGNLKVKSIPTSTVKPDSNGYLQTYLGASNLTSINKLSGGSFTLLGGQFITFDKSESTTKDTITIDGNDPSWISNPESFVSIEENPQQDASITFSGTNMLILGGISNTITNLSKYSGFIVKRFRDNSVYRIVIIPIVR